MSSGRTVFGLALGLAIACGGDDGGLVVDTANTTSTTGDPPVADSSDTATPADSSTTTTGGSSDTGSSGETSCAETGNCECIPSGHEPCDGDAESVIAALGLNCPGSASVEVTTSGSPGAIAVRTGFGATDQWAPREGSAFAVLGTGFTTDLDLETPANDMDIEPTHCNDDLGTDYDPGMDLPTPLQPIDVNGDCVADPTLLGAGDCSSTIQSQFDRAGSANDYSELRIVAEVPATNTSLGYDLAFFSTEYPFYFGSEFNDMYVGWLESERWTGNVSFDDAGNPISLTAGFLDVRDDGAVLPEFDGTCMKRHAGTQWLHTVAPVSPGETITLVLAVFDLSDSILDSYVFLDDFGWGCDTAATPSTTPAG
jgi:hypothetical protein